MLAVEGERLVLAVDDDRRGAGVPRIARLHLAHIAAQDLLRAAGEGGGKDDRLPGSEDARILHQPMPLLVAP